MVSLLVSLVYIILYFSKNPHYIELMLFLIITLGSTVVIFGNTSALAMNDLNEQVGIVSALFSFLPMSIGVLVASMIGPCITETASPLFVGFLVVSFLSLILFQVNK